MAVKRRLSGGRRGEGEQQLRAKKRAKGGDEPRAKKRVRWRTS